jgi:hypothetical protein
MNAWAIEETTLRNYWCFKEITKWRDRATLEAKRHLNHTKKEISREKNAQLLQQRAELLEAAEKVISVCVGDLCYGQGKTPRDVALRKLQKAISQAQDGKE